MKYHGQKVLINYTVPGPLFGRSSKKYATFNMAIVVTEDDAQEGNDHVDAHRSILMVISPWAKRNHVSHTHTSFGSISKTFWNILGTPCLNQYGCRSYRSVGPVHRQTRFFHLPCIAGGRTDTRYTKTAHTFR